MSTARRYSRCPASVTLDRSFLIRRTGRSSRRVPLLALRAHRGTHGVRRSPRRVRSRRARTAPRARPGADPSDAGALCGDSGADVRLAGAASHGRTRERVPRTLVGTGLDMVRSRLLRGHGGHARGAGRALLPARSGLPRNAGHRRFRTRPPAAVPGPSSHLARQRRGAPHDSVADDLQTVLTAHAVAYWDATCSEGSLGGLDDLEYQHQREPDQGTRDHDRRGWYPYSLSPHGCLTKVPSTWGRTALERHCAAVCARTGSTGRSAGQGNGVLRTRRP